jgi:hypothetical protein
LASHLDEADRRARAIRLGALALVWLAGLLAGFFGLLAAVATYGCADSDRGLACRTPGSLLGAVVVLAVIAVVTVVTVRSQGRPPRSVAVLTGSGLVALLACFVAARMLLDTV